MKIRAYKTRESCGTGYGLQLNFTAKHWLCIGLTPGTSFFRLHTVRTRVGFTEIALIGPLFFVRMVEA